MLTLKHLHNALSWSEYAQRRQMAKGKRVALTDEITAMLGREAKWHLTHSPLSSKSGDYERGFVAGIEHAQTLILKMDEVQREHGE